MRDSLFQQLSDQQQEVLTGGQPGYPVVLTGGEGRSAGFLGNGGNAGLLFGLGGAGGVGLPFVKGVQPWTGGSYGGGIQTKMVGWRNPEHPVFGLAGKYFPVT